MNPLNQVNIQERSTTYDIELRYHSDAKDEDCAAGITGTEEWGGKVSIEPIIGGEGFRFHRSDPDRVIAIAQMILSFAQMVKDNNKNAIDTAEKAVL